ncbi:MAG: hypothetical protein B6D46_08580 [Polyangiaceae bacterium UTPRO1]|jgi:phage shock protein PspC (stress-responsive transcriptional regulator)|nr:PspC domain-containing protein [Myxococcales bacterium]OQY67000.1 MAG: hypothetical protein B6D46_08580 [Polyangiaceae bacterium UTPRO1]
MDDQASKRCPYCAERIRSDATRCRYCGSAVGGASALTRAWYRVPETKMLAGVCSGLAAQFGISVTIVRLAFVLGVLVGWGMGLVLYLVLWFIMPIRPTGPLEMTATYRRVE